LVFADGSSDFGFDRFNKAFFAKFFARVRSKKEGFAVFARGTPR
jgi:hypothetical protein